ncbi:hypothetical protein REPUB_Repub13aG0215900 [Reevesia pubescens]
MLEIRSSNKGGTSASSGSRLRAAYRFNKDVTSFLFSNFPNGWKQKDLWNVFTRFGAGLGSLVDIFIPNRKDKKGGNFGFVRFKEVRNVNALLRSLDSIWFGSFKVRVAVANVNSPVRSSPPKRNRNLTVSPVGAEKNSFKEALLANLPPSVARPNFEPQSLVLNVEDEDISWLSNCAVGLVKEFESLHNTQDFLWDYGLKCDIIPLGGHLFLLKGEDKEWVHDFIKEEEEHWSCWFHWLKLWEPSVVPKERFTWVRITGLPLHAWSDRSFKIIGNSVGKFIKADTCTEGKVLMDKARLLISTPRWWVGTLSAEVDSHTNNLPGRFGSLMSEDEEEYWPVDYASEVEESGAMWELQNDVGNPNAEARLGNVVGFQQNVGTSANPDTEACLHRDSQKETVAAINSLLRSEVVPRPSTDSKQSNLPQNAEPGLKFGVSDLQLLVGTNANPITDTRQHGGDSHHNDLVAVVPSEASSDSNTAPGLELGVNEPISPFGPSGSATKEKAGGASSLQEAHSKEFGGNEGSEPFSRALLTPSLSSNFSKRVLKKKGRWVWDCFPVREKNKFFARCKKSGINCGPAKLRDSEERFCKASNESSASFESWSITDNCFKTKNKCYTANLLHSEVTDCLDFGKKIGLLSGSNEKGLFEKILNLERRDEEMSNNCSS